MDDDRVSNPVTSVIQGSGHLNVKVCFRSRRVANAGADEETFGDWIGLASRIIAETDSVSPWHIRRCIPTPVSERPHDLPVSICRQCAQGYLVTGRLVPQVTTHVPVWRESRGFEHENLVLPATAGEVRVDQEERWLTRAKSGVPLHGLSDFVAGQAGFTLEP
jgi:hypothetical protein